MKTATIQSFPRIVFDGMSVTFEVIIEDPVPAATYGLGGWLVGGKPPLVAPELVVSKVEGSKQIEVFTWRIEAPSTPGNTLAVTLTETPPTGSAVTRTLSQEYEVRDASPALHAGEIAEELAHHPPIAISIAKAQAMETPSEEGLWLRVLAATRATSFAEYSKYVSDQFCRQKTTYIRNAAGQMTKECGPSPDLFSGTRAYDRLKEITQEFMKARCAPDGLDAYLPFARNDAFGRLRRYLSGDPKGPLPAVQAVQGDLPLPNDEMPSYVECLDKEYRRICLVELIWSYWHEEAMLVQSIKAISRRFQNRAAPGDRDPLSGFEIDPLRALNNLLWGYIQDEQNRISVLRRAHEYEHHYGISLHGRAVKSLRPADRRSKFIESFHNLLYRCVLFFNKDDDRMFEADGFPVLNALKELNYLIAHGAHNQFGDLPETDREEKLIEQWLLARPEMREFLRGRPMVPYPEDWMDRVDHMKTLQGWTDTSVVHFHDLGVFGEQLLLTIRHGNWARLTHPAAAVTWARFWRPEIQGYIHAYRATTGVDLTAEVTDQRLAQDRFLPPSTHLQRRFASGRGGQ